MDFKSFFKLEVAKFFVQNCPIFKKIDFFTPASMVNKKKWGINRSKFFLPSARAAKTLQFDHQFHADWSIQSQNMFKSVKIVKIATENKLQFDLHTLSSLKCSQISTN